MSLFRDPEDRLEFERQMADAKRELCVVCRREPSEEPGGVCEQCRKRDER